MEFDYVVSLLACGLSFKQLPAVIECNRSVFETSGRQKPLGRGEVSCTSRIVCAIALQLMSDASTDEFGNAHLDARIRLPPVQVGKPLLSFHLLAIPLFNEVHSGQSLYSFMSRFLSALCSDWERRLIGSSTDGAPNMTGAIQGFSTRLGGAVAEYGPLYRVWCLAHQLDITVTDSISSMQNRLSFAFEKTLTSMVGYLRRQETLVRAMGSKCPYWINVRWKSMSNVLQWQLSHRAQIQSFCAELQFASTPSAQWWLVAMV